MNFFINNDQVISIPEIIDIEILKILKLQQVLKV